MSNLQTEFPTSPGVDPSAAARSSSADCLCSCLCLHVSWVPAAHCGGLCFAVCCLLLLLLQVESFWLSDTLPVPPAMAASSKAGSTCASAGHSRTSSIQGLSAAAGQHASSEALAALDAAEEAGGGIAGGSSMSGSSFADPFAAHMDAVQQGRCPLACWWSHGSGYLLWPV